MKNLSSAEYSRLKNKLSDQIGQNYKAGQSFEFDYKPQNWKIKPLNFTLEINKNNRVQLICNSLKQEEVSILLYSSDQLPDKNSIITEAAHSIAWYFESGKVKNKINYKLACQRVEVEATQEKGNGRRDVLLILNKFIIGSWETYDQKITRDHVAGYKKDLKERVAEVIKLTNDNVKFIKGKHDPLHSTIKKHLKKC